jgi:hypothetical protein
MGADIFVGHCSESGTEPKAARSIVLGKAARPTVPGHANAGAPSVTVSSWPTVSLPKSSGMKAPIDAAITIVPKKIVGEPMRGTIKITSNEGPHSTP